LEEIKQLFNLTAAPKRIEVYDNSHIMGSFAIGAMIVATQGTLDKKEYRTYNVESSRFGSIGGDDYFMLNQVMTRRLMKIKEDPEKAPGLMIIDGGKGHLSEVSKVMNELNIHIPFACMSKGVDRNAGREQFHMPNREIFTLDKSLPVMKYLQILRDEAHNFAIKTHRKKRAKAIEYSSLDQLAEIGEVRKKALLNYFGSYEAVKQATIQELEKVKGISRNLAKKIFDQMYTR
jgi:excinuclease ABC subunit C